jgi:[acyl-carrier-protein] S-malonyltransferase
MRPAAAPLAQAVDAAGLRDAGTPLLSNVTARPLRTGDELRLELVEQVARPVLWADSMRAMLDGGVRTFLEFGAGQVLTNLAQRMARDVAATAVGDVASARGAVSWVHGKLDSGA